MPRGEAVTLTLTGQAAREAARRAGLSGLPVSRWVRAFRALAAPPRVRVIRDPEGWPKIPGRYGAIEWYCDGQDCHGCRESGGLLAVWTDRPRLFAKLWTIPGVRRWQTGDREMRALFPVEALDQVAGVIRARRRRPAGSAAHLQKVADPTYRATSAA